MKDFFEKHSVTIVFVMFFLIVLLQHQYMYIYHDDYGYASLSYAYNVREANGHELSLVQIIQFLKGHYMTWGGRVLTFLYEICLLSNGLWLFRLVQSVIITLIFYLIYKIVKKCVNGKVNDLLLAICTVACYGVFEIMLFRTGIFWASASVSYVFPMLPFLAFIYLYQDSKSKEFKNNIQKILFYIFMAVLIFCSTFSQEQVGIAAFGYVVLLTIYNAITNKKIDKIDLIMCIVAIIGFGILMLAPGNALRQQHPTSIDFYSKPFLERIMLGIQNLILVNFSSGTKIFNLLFYACVCYASYKVVKQNKGIKWLSKVSLCSIAFVIFITITQQDGYFQYIYNLNRFNLYKTIIMFVFIAQLALMLYSVIIYLYENKQYKIINILISAVLSIGCMIMAPYFALRSSIVFEILCFIFILYVFQKIYDEIKDKKILKYILIPIFFTSFFNIFTITRGYYLNSEINKQNDSVLTEVSNKIKSGEDIKSITLKKLNNILYSGDQPYIEGNDYITVYMKEYYDLPKDFEIKYE